MFGIRFLRSFPAGICVGLLVALTLSWIFDSDIRDDLTKLYTFVISAFLSVLAATIALSGVLAGMAHQEKVRARERERELDAARALLPATLSALYALSEKGFRTCVDIENVRHDQDKSKAVISELLLPDHVVENLQDCIRASDGAAKDWLVLIPSYWQLYTARLDGILSTKGLLVVDGQAEIWSLDWLLLKAIVSHLFDFARTGEQPSETLASFVSVDLEMRIQISATFHEARTKYSEEITNYGGWSISGFKFRLSRQYNFPDLT